MYVNTRGLVGCNIPCDLYMEHLNRRLKMVLKNQGANIRPESVEKAGQCLGIVQHVCEMFEKQTSQYPTSQHHPYPSFNKDLNTVIDVLEEESVFIPTRKRQHASFKFETGLMAKLSKNELKRKIQKNINQLLIK